MQKILFDESTYIWKTKLDLLNDIPTIKEEVINNIQSHNTEKNINTDSYGYFEEWKKNDDFIGILNIKNYLDLVCQKAIDCCISLWNLEFNKKYNKINTNAWINIVKSKTPVQNEFKNPKNKYHTHTDKAEMFGRFTPQYTYVYYIQMPDIMEGEDGVLYIKSLNNMEYYIKPEIDDLIIFSAELPHAPNNAPKANVDRIVLAGNVGFEYKKKEKSLI